MNAEMSIKTYKVKHFQDFSNHLEAGYKVALFAQSQQGMKIPTSKSVKQLGLSSEVSTQIIRKYYANKKLKTINKNNVKLILPGRAIKVDKNKKEVFISCMNKITLKCWFEFNFVKINQIEFDKEYAYIACTFEDKPPRTLTQKFIGVDLNSTSHSVVIANQETGNVKKLGKSIPQIQKKYKNIRKKLQEKKAYNQSKKLGDRASRKINDQLHKITTKIVNEAKKTGCDIKIENLKGISKKNTKKYKKERNFTLNSWPFFKFKTLLKYKAILSGINVIEIDPAWTSQNCSKCLTRGNRQGKLFQCLNPKCGHIDHADVNAAFNIASASVINFGKNDKISKRGALAPSSGNDFESKLAIELHR